MTPLRCFVEIPKGSRNKYEWDPGLQAIRLDRFLFSSVVYPADYGFIPDTCAEDGEPLDALVCLTKPTFPGCLIEVRAVAVLRMLDDEEPDDKVLCVPDRDPGWSGVEGLDDVSAQLRTEIEHFFSVYKQLERKDAAVDGWYPRDDALRIIDEARERYAAGGS
jgi:inorganic pyrophosphatase